MSERFCGKLCQWPKVQYKTFSTFLFYTRHFLHLCLVQRIKSLKRCYTSAELRGYIISPTEYKFKLNNTLFQIVDEDNA